MAKPWVLLCCMSFSVLLIRAVTQHSEVSKTSSDASTPVSIDIDLARGHPVASTLFGIFFEEINYAGEGGLYAEMIQDRSFDAMALALGFAPSSVPPVSTPLSHTHGSPSRPELRHLPSHLLRPHEPLPGFPVAAEKAMKRGQIPGNGLNPDTTVQPSTLNPARMLEMKLPHEAFGRDSYGGVPNLPQLPSKKYGQTGSLPQKRAPIIPVSWTPHGSGSTLSLTTDAPLGNGNPVAITINASGPGLAGICNSGYWGINLSTSQSYRVSLYLKSLTPTTWPSQDIMNARIALEPIDASSVLATAYFSGITETWTRHEATLMMAQRSSSTNINGRLCITFTGHGTLAVDLVSLTPEANALIKDPEPWPFREDLLQRMRDLHPKFIRFPGGCYVEGDRLANAFRWKESVGPRAERPGHWNLWGYWSSDGLGLFEYMQLAQELNAEPVWVINNGVSHTESVPASRIQAWVQDALDSMEFISGPPDTKWGAIRAQQGHPEPWNLTYFAIGNEDCGKPWYVENYIALFFPLRIAYPHLRLIANCDMGDGAPTDMYDWHVYTDPASMFGLRTAFDGKMAGKDPHIFASEYAVTTGGGNGNLIAAIAEAAFMTGLERNSEVVQMAAYAPLFVHKNSMHWPTNLIIFDNHRSYGTVSYYVQQLFAQHQGVRYLDTHLHSPYLLEAIAASTTCSDEACCKIAVKVVNMLPFAQNITITLAGTSGVRINPLGRLITITSENPMDENSFDSPLKVAPHETALTGLGPSFVLLTPACSFSVVLLTRAAETLEKLSTA